MCGNGVQEKNVYFSIVGYGLPSAYLIEVKNLEVWELKKNNNTKINMLDIATVDTIWCLCFVGRKMTLLFMFGIKRSFRDFSNKTFISLDNKRNIKLNSL